MPVVGPWLAAFGVASERQWDDGTSPWLVALGLTQALGLATLVIGIVTQRTARAAAARETTVAAQRADEATQRRFAEPPRHDDPAHADEPLSGLDDL